MTCAATIVSISHWVGLTLPGMIELPGSFSGSLQFAKAAARARAEQADVVGDLGQRHGDGVEHARQLDQRVVRGELGELVGRRGERQLREVGDFACAKASAKPLGALSPVPTAVPPCASR